MNRDSAFVAGTRRQLSVPGASLLVITVGAPEVRPLVVVHGGPGEAHDVLRPFLDDLARWRRIVYYDQRGSGGSPLVDGVRHGGWREHVADLDAVRSHLGVEACDVLGFSWGATLAMLAAAEFPGRCSALVLVSPSWVGHGRRAPPSHAERRSTEHASATSRHRNAPRAQDSTDASRRAAFVARVSPALFDPSVAASLTPVAVDEGSAAAVNVSLEGLDLLGRVGSLRAIPSLVIRGREDPLARGAEELADALDARLEEIPQSGHAPFAEAPEAFVRTVSTFLAEVDDARLVR